MKAEAFIARLEKVKTTANGWIACCPAHEDRNPSLSVRELEDGRVLVHCFGGCSVEAIVSAVGMQMDDLFPDKEKVDHRAKGLSRPYPAHDVLALIKTDALFVAVCAGNMAQGLTLTDEDRAKLLAAAIRLKEAARYAIGERR